MTVIDAITTFNAYSQRRIISFVSVLKDGKSTCVGGICAHRIVKKQVLDSRTMKKFMSKREFTLLVQSRRGQRFESL